MFRCHFKLFGRFIDFEFILFNRVGNFILFSVSLLISFSGTILILKLVQNTSLLEIRDIKNSRNTPFEQASSTYHQFVINSVSNILYTLTIFPLLAYKFLEEKTLRIFIPNHSSNALTKMTNLSRFACNLFEQL